MHYPKLELPWRPNTAKENTKTAKETILGAMEILLTWRLAAKNHLLGGLAAKKSRAPLKLPKRQENVPPAKNITLLGG